MLIENEIMYLCYFSIVIISLGSGGQGDIC
jgi:hypothetical protein